MRNKRKVTGLVGVTGTVEAKPLDEKALADVFAAVREAITSRKVPTT